MLLNGPEAQANPIIYQSIPRDLVRKSTTDTKGSHSNADNWRGMTGTNLYGAEGTDLCKSMAGLTKLLCMNGLLIGFIQ